MIILVLGSHEQTSSLCQQNRAVCHILMITEQATTHERSNCLYQVQTNMSKNHQTLRNKCMEDKNRYMKIKVGIWSRKLYYLDSHPQWRDEDIRLTTVKPTSGLGKQMNSVCISNKHSTESPERLQAAGWSSTFFRVRHRVRKQKKQWRRVESSSCGSGIHLREVPRMVSGDATGE